MAPLSLDHLEHGKAPKHPTKTTVVWIQACAAAGKGSFTQFWGKEHRFWCKLSVVFGAGLAAKPGQGPCSQRECELWEGRGQSGHCNVTEFTACACPVPAGEESGCCAHRYQSPSWDGLLPMLTWSWCSGHSHGIQMGAEFAPLGLSFHRCNPSLELEGQQEELMAQRSWAESSSGLQGDRWVLQAMEEAGCWGGCRGDVRGLRWV